MRLLFIWEQPGSFDSYDGSGTADSNQLLCIFGTLKPRKLPVPLRFQKTLLLSFLLDGKFMRTYLLSLNNASFMNHTEYD